MAFWLKEPAAFGGKAAATSLILSLMLDAMLTGRVDIGNRKSVSSQFGAELEDPIYVFC